MGDGGENWSVAFYVGAHGEGYGLPGEHDFGKLVVAFAVGFFSAPGLVGGVEQLTSELPVAEISGGTEYEGCAGRAHSVQDDACVNVKSNLWRFVEIFPYGGIPSGVVGAAKHAFCADVLLKSEVFGKRGETGAV